MSEHIHKCPACQLYTLEPACPGCNHATFRPLPAKFSLADKYGTYRREARKEELRRQNLY